MSYENDHNISVLNGKHIVSITGLESSSDQVNIECSDGSAWKMVHDRDCCESVAVEDVVGDVADLKDATVIEARCETSKTDPADRVSDEPDPDRESFTWTFYIIQTNKGAVTIMRARGFRMSAQFAKWQPLPAHYIDCETLRLSQFAQPAETRGGKVAEFRVLDVRHGGDKPRIRVTVPQPLPANAGATPAEV